MHKLLGVFLVGVGAAGFSFSLCRDLKVRLAMLKEVKYMYELIQNEIRYTLLPMPQIFQNISLKIKSPFGEMLEKVSIKMMPDQGALLADVWETEARECLSKVPFTEKQKENFLRFPDSMGMIDGEGQVREMQRRIEELEGWIYRQEKEESQQQKMIMSVGITAGLMLAILLL